MEDITMLQEIVDICVNNGLSVILVGYFIYKDYKFNQQILDVLGEMKEVLACLKTWHEKEDN
jgi:hypothetical protein